MTTIRLPLPAYAYRFDLLLEFARRIDCPARMVVDGSTLWRYTCGQLVSYRQEGDAITVCVAQPGFAREDLIARGSERILGLDRDLSEFYTYAETEAQLWQVVEPLVGLPIFCTESVFEALITLIIEQHITWKSAMRSQRTLMQRFDGGTPVGRQTVYRFPAPQILAQASPAALKPLKITNGRIRTIIAIARSESCGELDLDAIAGLPSHEGYRRLLTIKGIGHWTAGNVIARALGRYPYVSQNDVALQAAINHYFHEDEGEKSADQVRATLECFGDFAGLAGHFTLLRWVFDRYPRVLA